MKNRGESIRHPWGASKPDHQTLAVFSLLLSSTLWGIIWYPLRLLEVAGLHGLWVTLVAYSAALLTGLYTLVHHRVWWRRRGGLLVAMSLASGWCNVAFILAMLDGLVMRVLLLFFLSPLWSVLFARVLLGERIQRRSMVTIVVSLLGALVMLWNPGLGVPWPQGVGDWLALSSGFAFALTNVLARKLDDVPVGVKVAGSWLGVIAVALMGLLLTAPAFPHVGPMPWLGAVLLGWFGFVLMTVAVVYGVTHMPVQRSAVILLFELVVGALSAWWLAGELMLLQEWLGGAMIVTAAYFSARRQEGHP